MSGKVPRRCTEDEISKVGGYNIQVNAIGTSCQLTRLCSEKTQECTYVVHAALLAAINAELTKAKVGAHEVSRDDNGRVTGRKKKNVLEGQKNQKDGDLIH